VTVAPTARADVKSQRIHLIGIVSACSNCVRRRSWIRSGHGIGTPTRATDRTLGGSRRRNGS
jgi:hypothetical protein